jgi:hypothetical protein
MRAVLFKSTSAGKKWMMVFYDSEGKRTKTTHFGAAGYEDLTQHKSQIR